jgi:broad-specificity NMP kinase
MKQKLILISGSPCVGKTTVSEKLYQTYDNSAYCDGDWMWCVNPFSVEDPRLRNGDKNMSYILSTYLNSQFEYVFFSSVVIMYEKIREKIIQEITANDYTTIGFSLTCSENTLLERFTKRGDQNEISYEWLNLGIYPGDHEINTDNKNVEQIINEIREIIN